MSAPKVTSGQVLLLSGPIVIETTGFKKPVVSMTCPRPPVTRENRPHELLQGIITRAIVH